MRVSCVSQTESFAPSASRKRRALALRSRQKRCRSLVVLPCTANLPASEVIGKSLGRLAEQLMAAAKGNLERYDRGPATGAATCLSTCAGRCAVEKVQSETCCWTVACYDLCLSHSPGVFSASVSTLWVHVSRLIVPTCRHDALALALAWLCPTLNA